MTAVGCLERCAGLHKAAAGARVALTGRRLARAAEVAFPAASGYVSATPEVSRRRRIEVTVPEHARTGRPRVVDGGGRRHPAGEALAIVPERRLPPPGSFALLGARVRPRGAFFDRGRDVHLTYRFRTRAPVGVRVKLVRGGEVARTWLARGARPYKANHLRWDGTRAGGHTARPGRYAFKVQRLGHPAHPTPRFRFYDAMFPVRGPHSYGGPVQRFGAPRTGGRVHQGQDVFASCDTPVVAAHGGKVQARGFDPVLYGNWVVIDGRGTRTDYRYAHFRHPASVRDGERVRTGQRIGRIGKTGNARTVGCQLHLEVWPWGWERRHPIDPLPLLKRWDGWS